jgi:hypothetical protein
VSTVKDNRIPATPVRITAEAVESMDHTRRAYYCVPDNAADTQGWS